MTVLEKISAARERLEARLLQLRLRAVELETLLPQAREQALRQGRIGSSRVSDLAREQERVTSELRGLEEELEVADRVSREEGLKAQHEAIKTETEKLDAYAKEEARLIAETSQALAPLVALWNEYASTVEERAAAAAAIFHNVMNGLADSERREWRDANQRGTAVPESLVVFIAMALEGSDNPKAGRKLSGVWGREARGLMPPRTGPLGATKGSFAQPVFTDE